MDKAKRYYFKQKNISHTLKRWRKKEVHQTKVTNKKTVNIAVIGGIAFLLFVGLTGAIRAITLSNK